MSGWKHHLAVLIVWPVVFAGVVLLILWAVGDTVDHFTRPTADQLYGCTVEQQAPNGECK